MKTYIVDTFDPKRAGEDVENDKCARHEILDDPASRINRNGLFGNKMYQSGKSADYTHVICAKPNINAEKFVCCDINYYNIVDEERNIVNIRSYFEAFPNIVAMETVAKTSSYLHRRVPHYIMQCHWHIHDYYLHNARRRSQHYTQIGRYPANLDLIKVDSTNRIHRTNDELTMASEMKVFENGRKK